jgi:hypothetical protein
MVLLGDEAQVIARFGLSGDSANLDARLVHGFCAEHTTAQKSFWTHPIEHLGDVAQVIARFGLFGDSANLNARLVHGFCAEHTTGSKIILVTPDRTPR